MFKKLLMLSILAGAGWYANDSGILYDLTHSMNPEPERIGEVCGPIGEGAYAAANSNAMRYVIDSHIGTASEKGEGRMAVAELVRRRELISIPDHTVARVVGNASMKVLGYHYPLTKIEILEGEYRGTICWVQREDLLDTPMQQFFQFMRGVPRRKSSTDASAGN